MYLKIVINSVLNLTQHNRDKLQQEVTLKKSIVVRFAFEAILTPTFLTKQRPICLMNELPVEVFQFSFHIFMTLSTICYFLQDGVP